MLCQEEFLRAVNISITLGEIKEEKMAEKKLKYTTISADSHVVEPPNLWLEHIDPAYRDKAPHVVKEKGNDVFKCEGVELFGIAAHSAAGKPTKETSIQGSFDKDVRPGGYDPHARVVDMATDGVQGEVIYPSVALRMYAISDVGYQYACFKAYNDWMIDEWCAGDGRGRLVPLTLSLGEGVLMDLLCDGDVLSLDARLIGFGVLLSFLGSHGGSMWFS